MRRSFNPLSNSLMKVLIPVTDSGKSVSLDQVEAAKANPVAIVASAAVVQRRDQPAAIKRWRQRRRQLMLGWNAGAVKSSDTNTDYNAANLVRRIIRQDDAMVAF